MSETTQTMRHHAVRRGDLYSVTGYEPGLEPLFTDFLVASSWAAERNLEDQLTLLLAEATGLPVERWADMAGVRWTVSLPDRGDDMERSLTISEEDDEERHGYRSWSAQIECAMQEDMPDGNRYWVTVAMLAASRAKADPQSAARRIAIGVGEFLWQFGIIDAVGIPTEPGEDQ